MPESSGEASAQLVRSAAKNVRETAAVSIVSTPDAPGDRAGVVDEQRRCCLREDSELADERTIGLRIWEPLTGVDVE